MISIYETGDGKVGVAVTDEYGKGTTDSLDKYEALDLVNEILAVTRKLARKK